MPARRQLSPLPTSSRLYLYHKRCTGAAPPPGGRCSPPRGRRRGLKPSNLCPLAAAGRPLRHSLSVFCQPPGCLDRSRIAEEGDCQATACRHAGTRPGWSLLHSRCLASLAFAGAAAGRHPVPAPHAPPLREPPLSNKLPPPPETVRVVRRILVSPKPGPTPQPLLVSHSSSCRRLRIWQWHAPHCVAMHGAPRHVLRHARLRLLHKQRRRARVERGGGSQQLATRWPRRVLEALAG